MHQRPVAETSPVAVEGKTETQASVIDAPKIEPASLDPRTAADPALAEAHKAAALAEAREAEAQKAMVEAQARAGAASDAEARAAEAETIAAEAETRVADAETRAAAASKAQREVETAQKIADTRLAKAVQAKADADENLAAAKQSVERRIAEATDAVNEAEAAIIETQQAEDRRIAKATEDKAKAEAALAEARNALAAARDTKDAIQQEVAAAHSALTEAKAAGKAAWQALAESARRLKPLSVFISRKTRRIYARQDFTPLFDAPVEIADAEREIGTHIFVSTRAAEDGSQLYWQAVSMPTGIETRPARKGRARDSEDHEAAEAPPPTPQPETAQGALDRVTIPEDIALRLSELAWVGASVIVSDNGISGETGPTTDFIILTRSRAATR